MKLSKKGEYAISALIHIYFKKTREVVSIHEIAQEEGIPLKFLEQIFSVLKKGGILTSRRGVNGGYKLSRSADQISIAEVIRLIEGPLSPWGDKLSLEKRVKEKNKRSGFYALLLEVRESVSQILEEASLEDVCLRSRQLMEKESNENMFYI